MPRTTVTDLPAISQASRRAFLMTGAASSAALLGAPANAQSHPKYGETSYNYEVTRSPSEWRAMLGDKRYEILREGGTEFPTSSDLWDDYRPGTFACAGCGLPLYISEWRAELDLGWVFFYHSLTDAVLTGVDRGNPYTGQRPEMGEEFNPKRTLVEVHCRRCGGHLGHIVRIKGKTVHCINGLSLTFQPTAA